MKVRGWVALGFSLTIKVVSRSKIFWTMESRLDIIDEIKLSVTRLLLIFLLEFYISSTEEDYVRESWTNFLVKQFCSGDFTVRIFISFRLIEFLF